MPRRRGNRPAVRPPERITLADTGAVYALLDRGDAWHERVRTWWAAAAEPIRLPECILPEVTYLLATRISPAAEQAFVQAVVTGEFTLERHDPLDFARAATLMGSYTDLPLGFVDATVAATAERLEVTTILTTDRRHFGVRRPAHRPGFTLVP